MTITAFLTNDLKHSLDTPCCPQVGHIIDFPGRCPDSDEDVIVPCTVVMVRWYSSSRWFAWRTWSVEVQLVPTEPVPEGFSAI